MSNLVADRRDVADSRVETLLRVRRAIQTLTDFGPNVVRKQQGRELTKVKIVHDGQWLRSGRARSERSGKRLTLTLRQSRFNPLGRFLAGETPRELYPPFFGAADEGTPCTPSSPTLMEGRAQRTSAPIGRLQ